MGMDEGALLSCSLDGHTASETARVSCNEQLVLFTTEQHCVLLLVEPFLKTSFKHRSI